MVDVVQTTVSAINLAIEIGSAIKSWVEANLAIRGELKNLEQITFSVQQISKCIKDPDGQITPCMDRLHKILLEAFEYVQEKKDANRRVELAPQSVIDKLQGFTAQIQTQMKTMNDLLKLTRAKSFSPANVITNKEALNFWNIFGSDKFGISYKTFCECLRHRFPLSTSQTKNLETGNVPQLLSVHCYARITANCTMDELLNQLEHSNPFDDTLLNDEETSWVYFKSSAFSTSTEEYVIQVSELTGELELAPYSGDTAQLWFFKHPAPASIIKGALEGTQLCIVNVGTKLALDVSPLNPLTAQQLITATPLNISAPTQHWIIKDEAIQQIYIEDHELTFCVDYSLQIKKFLYLHSRGQPASHWRTMFYVPEPNGTEQPDTNEPLGYSEVISAAGSAGILAESLHIMQTTTATTSTSSNNSANEDILSPAAASSPIIRESFDSVIASNTRRRHFLRRKNL
ncbi:hypothetical protein Pelo_2065 [Pelomyxa schiedti]|nr:hypothetical protein Pelo_2065 [Pelomyxa schiedti]